MHFVSMISIRLNASRGLSAVGLGGSGFEVVWYITVSCENPRARRSYI
jgi:hypothetical protein